MKFISFRISFLLTCCLWLSHLQAQQAVLSASAESLGTSGTVSSSVGQVACMTNTGESGFFIEGVQQPYEYLSTQGIEEAAGPGRQYFVYPNPANGSIKLKVETGEFKGLSCQLFNMNGFLLRSLRVENQETSIPLDDLPSATYSLTVTRDEHTIQTFLIIKK